MKIPFYSAIDFLWNIIYVMSMYINYAKTTSFMVKNKHLNFRGRIFISIHTYIPVVKSALKDTSI